MPLLKSLQRVVADIALLINYIIGFLRSFELAGLVFEAPFHHNGTAGAFVRYCALPIFFLRAQNEEEQICFREVRKCH